MLLEVVQLFMCCLSLHKAISLVWKLCFNYDSDYFCE